jgi:uncharacterized protein
VRSLAVCPESVDATHTLPTVVARPTREDRVDLTTALIGALVGLVVGLTSTGGASLLTPALVLVLGVPARVAVGSDVLIAAVVKMVGGGFYVARGAVDWPVVRRLAVGSVPGVVLGLMLLSWIPQSAIDHLLRQALGATLIAVGFVTVFHLVRPARAVPPMPSRKATAGIGFAIGLLLAMTSVGSGSLLMAALVLWFPLGASKMVGTDLLHALILSLVAGVGHYMAGRVDVALSANVLIGAIPGVIVGANLATVMPQRVLRGCLAATLVAVGLQLAGGQR